MSNNQGADKKEYTPFIISLLKNTTLSYPRISECVEKVFNVSLSRQSIYNYKNRYKCKRPSENLLEPKDIAEYYGFHNEQDKELEIKTKISVPGKKNVKNAKKEPKKASAKTIKRSEISNENFVPVESIRQVLKVAKIQYKNKSLNENYKNHFNQVERWLNEVAK